MKNFSINLSIVSLLFLLVISCKSNTDENKPKTQETKSPIESRQDSTELAITNNAFNFSKASYNRDGSYTLEIIMPKTDSAGNKLEFKIVEMEVETESGKSVLFLAQHGKANRESLRKSGVPTTTYVQTGNLKKVLNNFDPATSYDKKEKIAAIVLHDEDYKDSQSNNEIFQEIANCLHLISQGGDIPQNCQSILAVKDINGILKPRTFGNGGVIPPSK